MLVKHVVHTGIALLLGRMQQVEQSADEEALPHVGRSHDVDVPAVALLHDRLVRVRVRVRVRVHMYIETATWRGK